MLAFHANQIGIWIFFSSWSLLIQNTKEKETYRSKKENEFRLRYSGQVHRFWCCRVFGWLDGQKVLVNISLLTWERGMSFLSHSVQATGTEGHWESWWSCAWWILIVTSLEVTVNKVSKLTGYWIKKKRSLVYETSYRHRFLVICVVSRLEAWESKEGEIKKEWSLKTLIPKNYLKTRKFIVAKEDVKVYFEA